MKNKKLQEMITREIAESLGSGKKWKLKKEHKVMIDKMVAEALEDELEDYIETDDDYSDEPMTDMGSDEFSNEIAEIEDNYNIDVSQLDDEDKLVITVGKDGKVEIDKIETAEGEEFSAEELEDAGVIEKKCEEANTYGVTVKDPDAKNKIKYTADEEDERKYPQDEPGGLNRDLANDKIKAKENLELSGADFTIDDEDGELMVDDEGNVEVIDDYNDEASISGDELDFGDEDENIEPVAPQDEPIDDEDEI